METISITFMASVFGAGLLSFFSPCVLPLLPLYVGYLSSAPQTSGSLAKASLGKALAFTCGLSLSFFLLGFGAGSLGAVFASPVFLIVCGSVIILFGLYQTGLMPLSFLNKNLKVSLNFNPQAGLGGAFLLGLLFSFGWTPCVGPILGAVLGLASQQGSPLNGGLLLLVYALGLSLPFCAMALASQRLLTKVKGIYPHFGKIRLAGGMLIILMGCWMLYSPVSALLTKEVEAAKASEVLANLQSKPTYTLPLQGLDSEPISLKQFKGKTVYVKFWATWCPTCLDGLEDFAALAEQAKNAADIAVISIVTPGLHGEMSASDLTAWARAQKLNFPIYFDSSGALFNEFGIRAYPTAAYLSKDGYIIKSIIGHEPNAQIMQALSMRGEI